MTGARAQVDTCALRISLLTCAPGSELYSLFGHTAIRVQVPAQEVDNVFNYGTFAFTPDFYYKFIKGDTYYSLSVEPFDEFMEEYRAESRSVQEQELKLDCAEKQQLFQALATNAWEENRNYLYNFIFDNCTTRARDIIARNTKDPVQFHSILPKEPPTFRELIHSYLDKGHDDWSKLGIDLLLGAHLDKKVTNQQAMFLPDYLLKGIDAASTNNHRLASPPTTILQMPALATEPAFLTPAISFGLVLLLFAGLSLSHRKRIIGSLSFLDSLLFFADGLAGIVMLIMWFGTNHAECRDNFNLLWAIPTNVVMAFFGGSRRPWVRTYFQVQFWLLLAVAAAWFFLPQQMNPGLIPLVLLLIWRSWQLSKTKVYGNKRNSVGGPEEADLPGNR